jgi:hypothetical protein
MPERPLVEAGHLAAAADGWPRPLGLRSSSQPLAWAGLAAVHPCHEAWMIDSTWRAATMTQRMQYVVADAEVAAAVVDAAAVIYPAGLLVWRLTAVLGGATH